MAKILLKNGKIFDGKRFLSGSVLTEDEKIAVIGDVNEEAAEGAIVIDAEGCIVCPGLVDIHVHTDELSGDPYGFPALLETVPFGVTAAVDAAAGEPREEILSLLPIRLAALASLPICDGKCDPAAAEAILKKYGDRALGIKIYYDRGIENGCTLSHIGEASAFAHAHGRIVMVHCTGSEASMAELASVLSAGDIITHAYHGAPNDISQNNYEAYRIAKARGVIIDAGMAGGVHTDFSILQAAIQNGFLPDVISTDITRSSAYKRGGIYGMTMCMSICRALGMEETAVLRAVTSSAAKAVKRESEWGRLAAGRAADITVLSYEKQSVDITDRAKNRVVLNEGYACRLTVANGKILYRNGI
jgi:predicted amidohydrolase